MVEDPVISVVIPLPDDRGHAYDSLKGFTQQTLDVTHEVIVPTDAASRDEIAWLVDLFPQVHWIYRPGVNVNALYNFGAAVARGTYLYISESHCIPRADCLQQIYDFVQESGLPAACSASDGINANYVARFEQRIFEEDFHHWMNAKKCKIAIRGTLIERRLWEQIGGFQDEFGHFAEMLIGRQLEAAGVQFGLAAKSFVSHCNQVSLKLLSDELIEYGEDECRSCHLMSKEMHVANTREWAEREWLQGNTVWLRFRQAKESFRQRLRKLAITYLPMPAEWRFRVFRRYWQGAIRQGRLRYLASMKTQHAVPEEVVQSPVAYQKAA
ncbi:hypothetical protein Pan97_25730 [Bremerella volcania]|uniref:Glycosyltransferase 2-like domain-containing protein n=1 Tax=Bremerella volcania TaxID=2527984 RepID=A0A518C8K2_9BACT|nr:glycosyltransferase family A protein [Bremerella volcania]QDU75540.1 hypothetical protein Pan97_25730 [Bremerella volcania]